MHKIHHGLFMKLSLTAKAESRDESRLMKTQNYQKRKTYISLEMKSKMEHKIQKALYTIFQLQVSSRRV